MAYRENEKDLVRKLVLKNAVEILTIDRKNSTLINSNYVLKVKNELLQVEYNRKIVNQLGDDTIKNWENYFNSIVSTRKINQLKVAYLSGPNPENDLNVLVSLGVLPENVWAFESDSKTYNTALQSIINSKFPHIKIQKAKISEFFKTTPIKFDIIYLDFCGPLPNRNKKQPNLPTIVSLLQNHILKSPGVLITNFSLPTLKQDKKGREFLSKLISYYLYSKDFLERYEDFEDDIYSGTTEGAKSNMYSYSEWLDLINDNFEMFYGQFITRVIMDLACYIVPNFNFTTNQSYYSALFKKPKPSKNESFEDNLIFAFQRYLSKPIIESLEILYHLREVSKKNEDRESHEDLGLIVEKDAEFLGYTQSFLAQISPSKKAKDLIIKLEDLSFLLLENRTFDSKEYFSEELHKLALVPWGKVIFQFCDVFLFHQILEYLVGQLSVPYLTNISASDRWSYISKETRMFLNMFVFDECRYIYEWMPTIDNFKNSIKDIERQLILRFAMDGVNRHTRWYYSEIFAGTACAEKMRKPEFSNLTLKRRKFIN
jgi:hypothetical protein